MLRDKLWAYPWMIALLLAFIAYQIYRVTAVHFSAGLVALTVFDIAMVWLTWREYRSKRTSHDTATRLTGSPDSQERKPIAVSAPGRSLPRLRSR